MYNVNIFFLVVLHACLLKKYGCRLVYISLCLVYLHLAGFPLFNLFIFKLFFYNYFFTIYSWLGYFFISWLNLQLYYLYLTWFKQQLASCTVYRRSVLPAAHLYILYLLTFFFYYYFDFLYLV